jgi:hypothetical protein
MGVRMTRVTETIAGAGLLLFVASALFFMGAF